MLYCGTSEDTALPPMTDNLWVLNRRDEFIGQVSLKNLDF